MTGVWGMGRKWESLRLRSSQEVHKSSGNCVTHLALGCSPESDPSLAAMEECCRTGAEYCTQRHNHTTTQAHESEGFGVPQMSHPALKNTTELSSRTRNALYVSPVRGLFATNTEMNMMDGMISKCLADWSCIHPCRALPYLPRSQRLWLRSGGW
jgi:hypothetical protein